MPKDHLTHDDFFTALTSLLSTPHSTSHGSIYLTQKRLTFSSAPETNTSSKIPDEPLWDTHSPHPLPLIIRATDGKSQTKDRKKNADKVKLSTIVQPEEIEGFYARYAEVCKGGMQGLKKRDRSKRRKKAKGGGGGKGGAGGAVEGEGVKV